MISVLWFALIAKRDETLLTVSVHTYVAVSGDFMWYFLYFIVFRTNGELHVE